MGFKRYLLRNDAIYGSTNNWPYNNYSFPKNCTLVTYGLIWTVNYIGLL